MPEIENPYAQATVENFRRTPASLRPQLLKMLEQELNGTEADQTVSVSSFRRIPFDDRAEEFQWLAQNSARFQGEWVALHAPAKDIVRTFGGSALEPVSDT
jgi:hypothetical protein